MENPGKLIDITLLEERQLPIQCLQSSGRFQRGGGQTPQDCAPE